MGDEASLCSTMFYCIFALIMAAITCIFLLDTPQNNGACLERVCESKP